LKPFALVAAMILISELDEFPDDQVLRSETPRRASVTPLLADVCSGYFAFAGMAANDARR
jgi:hypothetical protein